MRVEVRDREWHEVFNMEREPSTTGWTIRTSLDVCKGRFSKRFSLIFTIGEGEYCPIERLTEVFLFASRPSSIAEFIHDCEMDEMRREGYYQAMSQVNNSAENFD